MTPATAVTAEFAAFVAVVEPRLRIALGSAFGFDVAEDAVAEAMAFAWEHWDRVSAADNPVGYVYAVGRNRSAGVCAVGCRRCRRFGLRNCRGSSPACPERCTSCPNDNVRW